jgi:circadian clock protein KaiB
MYTFLLYITGRRQKTLDLIETLKGFLSERFKDQYSLEIVDVLEDPRRAEKDMILATPTLVKSAPPPIRKIIGDFRNSQDLFALLNSADHT